MVSQPIKNLGPNRLKNQETIWEKWCFLMQHQKLILWDTVLKSSN